MVKKMAKKRRLDSFASSHIRRQRNHYIKKIILFLLFGIGSSVFFIIDIVNDDNNDKTIDYVIGGVLAFLAVLVFFYF